jgi:hypothetical protein
VVLSWPACLHTWFYQNTFETEQAHLWRTLAAPTSSLGGTAFGDPGQRICMRFLCNSACPDSPPSVQGPGSTNLLIKPPIPAYANQRLNEGINWQIRVPGEESRATDLIRRHRFMNSSALYTPMLGLGLAKIWTLRTIGLTWRGTRSNYILRTMLVFAKLQVHQ